MVSAPRRARNSGQGRAQRPPTLDRRVSQKAAESRKRRLLRSSASVLVQMSAATKWRVSRRCVAAFPASDVSRAERVRLSVDSGRSQPRRSPGVPATPSATPCRDGLRVRRGLARHRATERAISARVRVAGGKSGSAESGRPEPSRALRARRGRVQGPNRRRRRGGENLDRRRTPARGRAHGPDPRGASVSARRAASRPHLLYFPLAGAFPRLRCERAIPDQRIVSRRFKRAPRGKISPRRRARRRRRRSLRRTSSSLGIAFGFLVTALLVTSLSPSVRANEQKARPPFRR